MLKCQCCETLIEKRKGYMFDRARVHEYRPNSITLECPHCKKRHVFTWEEFKGMVS